MRINIFKRYNKVKYMFRVKHWHGRDIHSPFAYRIVREGIMKHKSSKHIYDKALFHKLNSFGVKQKLSIRIARVYMLMNFRGYTLNTDNYNGEDMLIIRNEITNDQADDLIARMLLERRRKCIVIFNIYRNSRHYSLWKYIIQNTDVVAFDMYHMGLLFIDEDLNHQCYKIKI